jgi:hypothetical protein
MRNIGFIVVIVIYAVIYIVRLSRKARAKTPLPRTEAFPRDEIGDEEQESTPSLEAHVPEPVHLTPEPEPEYFEQLSVTTRTTPDTEPSRGIFQRLEKMTPFARAFVMSEVLGKPKGKAASPDGDAAAF